MSGLVAIATVLGSAAAASAASANAAVVSAPVTRVTPEQARSSSSSGIFLGDRISCGSTSACLAVGMKNTSSGGYVAIAVARNGTKWKSVSVPKPAGATAPVLTGVSCKAAKSCLVTGEYSPKSLNGRMLPYAMTWNGTRLKLTTRMVMPKSSKLLSLNGLSCVKTTRCVAIGSVIGGNHLSRTLVETWKGTKWTAHTARNPGGAIVTMPSAVSCRSLTSCVVTGESFLKSGAEKIMFARWNGKSFAKMKTAAPAGVRIPLLSDVSCVSANRCVAVGYSLNKAGTAGFGFAEIWKGTKWTPAKMAWPKADSMSFLFGISCASATNCVAVGAAGTVKSGRAKALFYNGRTWKFQRVPGPGKGKSSDFEGVSCPKAKNCTGIGSVGPANGSRTSPLGGRWGGSAWRLKLA